MRCVDRAGFGLAHAHERIGSFATPPDLGHLFLTLNVNRLMPVPLFQAGVFPLIQQLRASELATGVEHIYLPGELECRRREVRLQDGIPLPEEATTTLQAMAEDLGLALELGQLPGDDHGYVAVYPHAAHHPAPSCRQGPQQTINIIEAGRLTPSARNCSPGISS